MNSDWIKAVGVVLIVLAVMIPPWIVDGGREVPDRIQKGRWASVKTIAILVDTLFVPDEIEIRTGEPVRLVFYREREIPCNEFVVLPELGKKLRLAPNRETHVSIGSLQPGEFEFTCGMGMMHGVLRVGL